MDVRDRQLPLTHRDLALLTARSRPFSSTGWLFELKYDGYRTLALRDDVVRILSRQGRDLTAAFPEVAGALRGLPRGTALDGELVILVAEGRPQFDPLARAWRATPGAIAAAARSKPATLIAFDVLYRDGEDLRPLPIERRKETLADAVAPGPRLRPLLPISSDGEWLYRQAEALQLEGVVAKRKGSPYRAGRTDDWLKIKTPYGIEVERQRFERG